VTPILNAIKDTTSQWAKSPKKQSEGVRFGNFAHWVNLRKPG